MVRSCYVMLNNLCHLILNVLIYDDITFLWLGNATIVRIVMSIPSSSDATRISIRVKPEDE